jgi:5'-3' exonuclease
VNVHLVDGTFELFRCFHGAPRARTEDGREVGAVRGLLYTLVALLRRAGVTHVAVAFDQMAGRARGGSGASDDALLRSQAMTAIDAVRALGITLWPMHRFQADDALASGAARYAADPRVKRIVVCTTDKDLLQCVRGDRVVLLDRIRDRITDEPAVRARFGVGPSLIPDLFALVGDPSDGLPGIPRWGAKAAATLLAAYGGIEHIPDDAASWTVTVRGAAALAGSLRRHRREALVMRDLGVLRDDLPIRDALDDLEWRGPDRPALTSLVARIGADEVLERVARLEP